MTTPSWIKSIYFGGSFICERALNLFQSCTFKCKDKQSDTSINEILLYGADCEEHTKQIGLNNILCIYYVLLHANKSVAICVPSLVSGTLAKCLINMHQKNNVKIRIIIHNSDNFQNLNLFAQNGIEVKIVNPVVRLEHEFLLIDVADGCKDGVAVMGSLDYETTQPNCNRDATMLTSELSVVAALKKEFERIWNSPCDLTKSFKIKNL